MKKPDEEVIIAKEKATWQSYKDKRADDFKKLVSSNLVAMGGKQVATQSRQHFFATGSATQH